MHSAINCPLWCNLQLCQLSIATVGNCMPYQHTLSIQYHLQSCPHTQSGFDSRLYTGQSLLRCVLQQASTPLGHVDQMLPGPVKPSFQVAALLTAVLIPWRNMLHLPLRAIRRSTCASTAGGRAPLQPPNQASVSMSDARISLTMLLGWLQRSLQTDSISATSTLPDQASVSMSDARISLTILLGWLSRSLNTDSITLSSVAVVSYPQNAACARAGATALMECLYRGNGPTTVLHQHRPLQVAITTT